MKICNSCKEQKDTAEFYKEKNKKDGLRNKCKNCIIEYQKKYDKENEEKIRGYQKEYRKENAEQIKEWRKNNKEYIKECAKKYCVKNRSKINEKIKKRRKNDPQFRIACSLRNRTNSGIIDQNGIKSASTQELLGCSFEEARIYLENQFLPGMSWENYPEWEIDHIRPMASFDLTDPEQQKLCCHYTNLQPLWAKENSSKGAKWNYILA